jgi:hypothetical protein
MISQMASTIRLAFQLSENNPNASEISPEGRKIKPATMNHHVVYSIYQGCQGSGNILMGMILPKAIKMINPMISSLLVFINILTNSNMRISNRGYPSAAT